MILISKCHKEDIINIFSLIGLLVEFIIMLNWLNKIDKLENKVFESSCVLKTALLPVK